MYSKSRSNLSKYRLLPCSGNDTIKNLLLNYTLSLSVGTFALVEMPSKE